MDLLKKPSLFNRDCWLKMLCLSLFVLFSFSWAYADGSRDLYASGTGLRAQLRSSNTVNSSSWPFPNEGVHYVYAKAGEIITLASSAVTYNSQRIELYNPQGTKLTLSFGTSSNPKGVIADRREEQAGPKLSSGDGVANRYTPIEYTIPTGGDGIYMVKFHSIGSGNGSTVTANTNTFPNNSSNAVISAWDVSIINSSRSSFVGGRVYVKVLNLSNGTTDPGTNGFYGTVYPLTKDGYTYRVNNNGNNGQWFTFFVNNNGIIKSNGDPTYKSLNSIATATQVQNPNLADEGSQITQKIFYTLPNVDMPTKATGITGVSSQGLPITGETWLKNKVIAPDVRAVSLKGVDGTDGQVSNKGGYIHFDADAQGQYTILIKSREVLGHPAYFNTRILTGTSIAGKNKIFWDGKDGGDNGYGNNSAALPNGNVPATITVQLQGAEVHFPFFDMEYNSRGVIIELLDHTNLNNVISDIVYWNDDEITNNGVIPKNNTHLSPTNSTGISSNSNGHKWSGGTYGDVKSIDTWTFIKGEAVTANTDIAVKIADLKISAISHNKESVPVKVNDIVTYTIKVKNDGPSDVTGAPFTFTLPTGFIPDPDETVVFASGNAACGSEAIALTYNSTTRKYSSTLNLPNGCEVTYTIPSKVTSTSISGPNTAEATILRPKDVTDPDATNPDPNTPPTDPYFECNPSGGAVTCNNIKTTPIMVAPRSDLAVTKSISNNKPAIGDNVTFTISVVNNGPDAATDVEVTDKLPSGYTVVSSTPSQGSYSANTGVWAIGSLSNGASVILTVIGTVQPSSGIPNEYRNTATISNSSTDDPDPSNNTGTAEPEIPKYTLVKGAKLTTDNGTLGKADVDDVITYTFTVKNTGNVTLKNVTVSDPLANLSTISPASVASLAPDVSTTFTATYTVVQTDVDHGSVENVATVNGNGPDGTTIVPPVESTPEDPNNPGTPDPGKTPGDPTVVPGADQQPDLSFVKTAVITTDNNTNGKADKDDIITYTFTVRNTGNTTLNSVTIADPMTGLSSLIYTWPVPSSVGVLAPGQSVTATATYTVKQPDVDAGKVSNQATAKANDPNGDPLDPTPSTDDPSNPGKPGDPVDPIDRTEVPANQVSDLSFVKTAVITTDNNTNGKADKDDIITYTFTVRNTGNTTLNSVTIADPMTGLSSLTYTWPVPSSVGVLAPGESVTATATYTVKQSDVDAGKVSNQATAKANDPNGDPLNPTPSTDDPSNPGKPGDPGNPTIVDADNTPSYTLVKGAKLTTDKGTVGKADVDDVITYTFTVKNTGKVTLKNVTVSDPLANLSTISPASVASLAPGVSATFTATYTVVQADVDRGSVENVATVKGKGPDGTTTVPPVESTPEDPNNPGTPDPGKTPGDPTIVDADNTPSYTLVKGAKLTTDKGTVGKADVDDIITYTFTVKNTGKVTLKNVTVSDPLANLSTISPASVASLAPGVSATFTATYTVVQADVDRGSVENVATVKGKGPDGTTTVPPVESTPEDPNNPGTPDPGKTPGDPTIVDADNTPSYTLVKGAKLTTDKGTVGKADVDDIITYTFTVKNTGKVTLKNVTVSDPLANLSTISPASVASLAPGVSATFTATYTVVQADVDRGSVENVATVKGKGPDGTTTVPPVESTPEDPNNPGTPDPGKTPGDPTIVDADNTPSYTLVKGAKLTTDKGTVGKADVDDVITYTFTVKNTGKVTLQNVTVSDPLANLSTISPASVASLAPGVSATFTATYTVVQADVDRGSVENVATVKGKGPDGTTTVPPVESTPEDPNNPGTPDPGKTPGDPTIVDADNTPSYTLVKGAKLTTDKSTVGKADVDDVITYTFTVKNTGKVTLKNVTVSDPLANLSTISPASVASLAPGVSATFTATYTVVQADVDRGSVENVATVKGKGPDGTTTVPPVESTPEDPNNPGTPDPGKTPGDPTIVDADNTPSYTLVKGAKLTTDKGTVGKADVDDIITYTFTVKNTGKVTLKNVTVSDPLANLSTISPASVASLAPGVSATFTATYTVVQADVDRGSVENVATVKGKGPDGTTTVPPVESTPEDPNNPGTPDPGKTPGDPTIVDADNTPSYTLVKGAKLTTDKGTVGKADVDDIITYTFTVKNTGKVTLKNVTVSDPLANLSTISPASVASLAPGVSATFTATYTVVQADVDRGSVENVATVKGKGPDGTTTVPPVESTPEDPNNPGTPDPGKTPGDPTIVDADNTPSYTLVKGAKLTTDKGTVGKADVDDVITYTFTVKNTGKVTLQNVTVSDPLANLSTISPASVASLAPGVSATFTATYTVVQADVDRGSVENVATVKGKGPDGTTTVPPVESTPEDPNNPGTPDPGKTPGDPTVVEADDAGELKVVKTSLPVTGFLHAGDKIEYLIEVINTGKVTLFDVVVTDANADDTNVGTIAKLEVGKTVQLTAFHTITQADMIKGFVSNIAKAEGKDPKDNPVTGESTSGNTPKPGDPTDPNCTDCTITPLPWVPIEAVVDTPPAINGKDGGTTPNVLDNDKLNNKPVDPKDVVVTVEKPADPKTPGAPVPTLDPNTGIVTVDPETPAGSYEITYKICEVLNPSNCSTTTVTIVVEPAPIEAVVDTPPAINGKDGGTTPNVLDNDKLNNKPVDPKDVVVTVEKPADPKTPGAPVPTLDLNTGIVTVDPETPAGSYEITYKICEVLNPSNCSTTTVTIVVEPAPIEAVVDTPPAINGKDGGTTPNVLDNDKLNNKPVDPKDVVVTVEKPADPKTPGAPVPTLDPNTGIVTVDPETPAGSYEITYKICEVLNPSNCSTTTVTIVVEPAPIEAVVDMPPAINGKDGGTTPNVLDNDKLNNKPVDPKDVVVTVEKPADPKTPGAPVPTLDPNTGIVTVDPETPAGSYEITYKICEVLNPSNCSTTTVTIVVEPAPIEAVVDTPPAINGKDGDTTPNVLDNDKLNNKPVDPKDVVVTVEKPADPKTPGAPVPTLDPNTGIVTVDPETPAGSYEITYKICEVLNPSNCSTTTVTIVVEPAPIEAVVDTPPAINGKDGGKTPSVIENDKLNNKPVDPKDVVVTVEKPADPKTPGAPVPTLDPNTGIVTVDPETPAGSYEITYKICEVLNPSNCSTTTVTIVVEPAPIEAVVDTPPAINGKDGGTTPNVIENDKLNNKPVDPKDIVVTVEKPADPKTPGAPVPTLDPNTGIVTVDPETPAGSYEITYKICEVLNPSNCSTTTVTIVVEPAPIEAVVDTPPAINGKDGGTTPNVLDNDKLNNKPVDPKDIVVTVEKPADPKTPGAPVPTLDPNTGIVTVDPETPAGSYEITYKICEVLNPSNCSTTTVTIVVEPAPIKAENDTPPAINGKDGGKTPSVVENDKLNNKPVDPKDVVVTVEKPADPKTPGAPVPTLDPKTGVVTVDPETPAGEYEITYKICEVLNPNNCSTATITIKVAAPEIKAVQDEYGPYNGKDGGETASVFENDLLNKVKLNPNDIELTAGVPVNSAGEEVHGLIMNKNGKINVQKETAAGKYYYPYTISEKLNPSNKDNTVAIVTVIAAPISAENDRYNVNGKNGGTTPTVLTNDKLNNKTIDPKEITLTPGNPVDSNGKPTSVVKMNTDGTITVAPNTPQGKYEYPYTICEVLNPTSCKTAVAIVEIQPAPIVASDDSYKVEWSREGVTTASVLPNDKYNGKAIDLDEVTLQPGVSSNPGLSMNPDGTINIAPSTRPGTYTYPYTICEVLNPTNCSTAVATIVIEATNVFIPNTFTPNGDGVNDKFEIVGIENFDRVSLTIVNRWGNEVYRNDSYKNEWNGSGLNEGTYYYIVTLRKGTTETVHKGWVLIKTR